MATQNQELDQQSPKTRRNSSKKEFIWTDDEVKLLLNVANDYKASKAAECIDWESAIRLKFQQAIDSGRRSGHGRVVMIYYELCEKLWGGSPATERTEEGMETVELIRSTSDESNVNGDLATSDADVPVSDDNMAASSSVDAFTNNKPQESDGDGCN
uniref:Uncharacterized protein n=1 Tax=Amphimedon queenslandica TaxID=400682 RepID=A0A1X7U5E6_AMPQE